MKHSSPSAPRPVLKRLLALLVCAILLLPLLSGCHGSKSLPVFELPEALDESKPLEIVFWAKNDTNKAQTLVYQRAIDEFEALYPHIKVNLRLYTDYGKIYNDVITNIATGTTPHVCITYPDHIATYMTGENIVVPLDELLQDATYGLGGSALRFEGPTFSQMIPSHMEECAFDGHYYAVPFMRSTEALYINQDFVEALGYEVPDVVTWDFIFEVSEKAAEKDSEGTYLLNGQKVMIPFIYKSTDNMMIQWLRQEGAGYSSPSGEILLFNDTTKENLYRIADSTRAGAFSTFKISSYPANFLNAGQCVFAVDSTAGATWMGSDAPLLDISADKLVPFQTAVRMVPQVDPQNPQMISQGPSICLFNKHNSQEVLAAWLFTQYLLTNPIQLSYAETEGYAPVTSLARESAEYQDYLSRSGEDNSQHYAVKIEATRLLLDNADRTFTTPVFNGSASLRDAAGQLIENVTKSIRRGQTVDEAYMDQMFQEVTALYRLDQLGTSNPFAEADRSALGPLPAMSRVLLITLAAVWILIGVYYVLTKVAQKKRL